MNILTEEAGHEGHAVGEHGALDNIEVGQHKVDEETRADGV